MAEQANGAETNERAGASDLAAALIELGRALRGRRFYAADHPLLGEMIERARGGIAAELERNGPLVLGVVKDGFRLADGARLDGHVQLVELARDFAARGVRELRLEREIDAASLRALLDVAATAGGEIKQAGGFAKVFYARRTSGIVVNGAERSPEAGTLASDSEPAQEARPQQDKPDLEADVFAAAGGEPPALELVDWLRELDACADDARYLELARQIRQRAALLADDGALDEGYRTCLLLASHSAARSKRSEAQKAIAFDTLRALATGSRLADLIDRACAPGAAASLRAAQILLQIGADAAPTLLRQLEATNEADRRGQLSGILIAIGKKAVPELVRSMEGGDPRRARSAAHLAGEIQSTECVPSLQKLLRSKDAELRKEAAKALAKVSSEPAIEVLCAALSSEIDGVPGLVAYCLGVTESPQAVGALMAALRRATRAGDDDLARESIRALGRLAHPIAAADLAKILGRRAFFGAKRLAELKLAAANALARIPGNVAKSALADAAKSGDERVREVARAALARRTEPAVAG